MKRVSSQIGPRLVGFLLLCPSLLAADESQPATGAKIDFDRDVRPILETSCLRCHGPEKPRSHFRLDNRLAALKGGDDNSNDLVPGNSAHRILIKNVPGHAQDMQMPPEGRGAPLTTQQIEVLRAWIDQGVDWKTTNQPPQLTFAFSPEFRWINVSGNKGKFRELEGVPTGFTGGVQNFSMVQQVSPDEKVTLSGHVVLPGQDIDVQYALDKTDIGFIHAGLTEWRKYYNDTGGFDSAATPPGFELNRNLYIDNGRAWVDFGLALPQRPQVVLGYEYQFREGSEANLDWGIVNTKNIYPATQAVNERTHILKLGVTYDLDDWHLEDNARVEYYRLGNDSVEPAIFLGGTSPDTFFNTRDIYKSFQGMNTLTLEKQIRDWWFASGGFYYSKLSGSDFFNQVTTIPSFSFSTTLASQQITLRRESEIFSLASLFTPLDYLTFSIGAQNEWTSQDGFGASVPDFDVGANAPAGSTSDTFKASQNADIRFTKIPFTVFYADAQVEEKSISESEEEDPDVLLRQSSITDDRYDLKAGFNVSPWRWVSWNTQFDHKASRTDYDNPLDIVNSINGPTNGYPAFILNRKIKGDELETKLDLRPARWLKTTLTYQWSDTKYSSTTDPAFDFTLLEAVSPGGTIVDGHYKMQTVGVGTTITPVPQFYLNGTFTYSHSRAVTADNGDPSIVPYRGAIFTASTTATYAWNAKTALQAAYIFTTSDYGENNAVGGVPLGLDFTRHELIVGLTRQLTQHLTAALHYEFSQYTEAGTGNGNNFTANGIFASFAYRWP